MITHANVLEQDSTDNLIDTILTECPELRLNSRILNMYAGSLIQIDNDIFRTLATYALQQKFNRVSAEFVADYKTLSELHSEYLTLSYSQMNNGQTNIGVLNMCKAYNISHDLERRAFEYTLWSEFHEVKR